MGPSSLAIAVLAAVASAATPAAGPPSSPDEAAALAWDAARGPVPAQTVGAGDRAAGTVFIGYRGVDGETTGAIATLAPIWRTFVRVGAEVTPRSPDGAARFLWGLGFESPRDRTFFVDVHDWGPLRPGHAPAPRSAEASLGYKLPRLRGGPVSLEVSPFAAMPLDGGAYAGASSTLVLRRRWFLSAVVGWGSPGALPGTADRQRWRASFALGRWDGRPGGLFFTYRDETGSDGFRSWRPADRQGLGVVAVGVNWSY